MTVTGGNVNVRRLMTLGPTLNTTTIPLSSEIRESVGPDLLGGEMVTKSVDTVEDYFGTPVGADTPMKFSNDLKLFIAAINAFECVNCSSIFSKLRLAKLIAVEPDSVTASEQSGKLGVCSDCWEKGKQRRMWASIFQIPITILRLIIIPFLTPPPPPSIPPPSPPPAPRSPPSRGGTAISILIAAGLLACTTVKAMIPITGCDATEMRGAIMNNKEYQSAAQAKAILMLIQEARSLGLDNPSMSMEGVRRITNIERGLKSGNIPEYDLNALASLVARARKIIIPMEWRVAFAQNPPPDIIGEGDIHPFTLLDGTPVGLTFLEMAEAMRSTGRPGSSKSTGGCAVVDCSIGGGKSVFFIDSKGDGQADYLCRKYPGRVIKVRIGRLDKPFFNPWQWVGVNRDYFLTVSSRKDSRIVLDAAIEIGMKQNTLSGVCELTHSQLMRIVKDRIIPTDYRSIKPEFFQSIQMSCNDIARSPLSHQIACQRGYDLKEIVTKGYSVIIDTSAIAGSTQEEFLVVTLLAAIRQEIINTPILRARPGTQVIFFQDEGSNLAASSKVPGGLSAIVQLSTLVRSSSICLFFVYHSMSIAHPVLNAAGIWMVCQIFDGNDIFTAKRTFALTDQQAKALTTLPKGVAMMRMGNRYTEPFLISYPRIPDAVKMTDAEIDANNAPILATLPPIVPEHYRRLPVPVTVTPPVASSPVPPAVSVVTPSSAPVAAPVVTTPTTMPSAVDNDFLAIMRDIASNLFLNVSGRAAHLTLPSGKALTFKELRPILDELKAQGFVDDVTVQLSPRGAPSLMHFLTAEGYAAIGSVYKPSRSGYKHDWGQRLIKDLLAEKSISATLEMALPGTSKVVDVGFICPVTGLPIAIELPTTTFDSEPDQAERDLAAGWARVIEVCFNKNDLENLEKTFAARSSSPDSRIKLSLMAGLKAVTSLPEIYDSSDFVFKVKTSKPRNKKDSAI